MGGADRVHARFRGIARIHLAAGPRLGGAGRHRCADHVERLELLAGAGGRRARRRARRLAVLLGRRQARPVGRAYLAALPPSGTAAARRSLRAQMGRARHLHRPVLRAAARIGAADRRHFRDAVLALPDRQFHFGVRVGRGAADAGRCGRQAHQVALGVDRSGGSFCDAALRRILLRDAAMRRGGLPVAANIDCLSHE